MKALVQRGYGGVGNLGIEEIEPRDPKAGEVAVRVEACGANASDWEFTTGKPAYARVAGMFRPQPRVLGSDVVGIVEAVGEGAGLEIGQRVLADTFGSFGGFAEVCIAKADRFVPVPAGLEPERVACLPQSGAIVLDFFDGRLREGARVLVNGGGGGCGPMAIQYAAAMGADVTGIDNAVKQDVMRQAGAAAVYDYKLVDFAKLGRDWDLILDLYGTRPARMLYPCLATGGQYRMVGGPVPTLLNTVLASARKRRDGKHVGVLSVNQGPTHLPKLLELLKNGTIAPIIGEIAPLDEAPQALARMGAGQIAGKLVIRP